MSSTDRHLLRKCPCPVWLTRRHGAPPKTVLAAVDVDAASAAEPETQGALNRRILDVATTLATRQQAELVLLHVWNAPAEGLVRRWSTGDDEVTAYLDSVTGEAREAMAALAEQAGGTARLRLERGTPRRAIPALIAETGADLLVMGTLARTGIPGLLIGNTAEDVLDDVAVPVVTVKPPGYQTPLKL